MKEIFTMWRHTQLVVLDGIERRHLRGRSDPVQGFPHRARLYRAQAGQRVPGRLRATCSARLGRGAPR